MTETLAVLLSAGVAGLLGWFAPVLVAALPEPHDDHPPDPREDPPRWSPEPPESPKELYADLATRPGFAVRTAVVSAMLAGSFAAVLGMEWPLLYLVPLTPLGVVLAVIDWRTRLLPMLLTVPVYPVLLVVLLVITLITGDWAALWLALGGGAAVRGFYWLFWRFTRGMGFGDVRLAGLIGLSLGLLGWPQLLTGVYAGFLLGAVGGTALVLLRVLQRRGYPFGPFMLLGAACGILLPPLLPGYLGS